METIAVAYHPGPFVSALFVGNARGYFAEQGLQLKLKEEPAGASSFGVASGACDVGYCNIPALLKGRATGLPLKVVASASSWPRNPADATIQVVVPRGSSIIEPADLEWHSLAVNSLGQLSHLSVIVSARKLGVTIERIRFVAMPFASMEGALRRGEVDAADMSEPELTPMLDDGARVILPNSHGFVPETTQSVWITSEHFASRRPQALRRFRLAIQKANDHCAAHPDDLRQVLTTFIHSTPQQAARMKLPHFSNRIDSTNFQGYLETMRSLQLIWTDVDLQGVFLQ